MEKKIRATLHNGRTRASGEVFSVKHNDRNCPKKNLNPEPERRNLYFIANTDGTINSHPTITFEEHEKKIYEQLFSKTLNAKNERHIKAGHASRVRSMDEYRTSPRTAPEETILQLGNREEYADPNSFIKAVNLWCTRMHAAYGSNWRLLDGAVHFDESTPHCHIRVVWTAQGPDGIEVSQNKSLAELGFQRADLNAPQNRHNNAKMVFTQVSRDVWIEAAKECGISIEEIPETPGKSTLTKEEYIKEKVRAETAKLAEEKVELQQQVNTLAEETNRLKGVLQRLRSILSPIERLFEKLAKIKLGPNRSVLDDVLDTTTVDSLEALREFDEERL